MAIEDFDQVTIAPAKLRPFSKFIMSIGELPTSYLDSMSYAEQVTWFCDYLQNNVIPALNNNAEALKEVQNLMTQLQEYVDNYFEIGFPAEVNRKLDEMAEDGTLQNLLNNYANVQKTYNTYTELLADSSTFINGLRLKTLGYYTVNDGGQAEYIVTNTADNTKYQVELSNSLYLELIVNDKLKVKQFGAYGDNIHDDTTAIQNAINYGINTGELYINNGLYKITDTLIISKGFKIYGEYNKGETGNNSYVGSEIIQSTVNKNIFDFITESNTMYNMQIENIRFKGNDGIGFNIDNIFFSEFVFKRLIFNGSFTNAIYMNKATIGNIEDCSFSANNGAIELKDVDGVLFINNNFWLNENYGIKFGVVRNCYFLKNWFENDNTKQYPNLLFQAPTNIFNCVFENCGFQNDGKENIKIDYITNITDICRIINNRFNNCSFISYSECAININNLNENNQRNSNNLSYSANNNFDSCYFNNVNDYAVKTDYTFINWLFNNCYVYSGFYSGSKPLTNTQQNLIGTSLHDNTGIKTNGSYQFENVKIDNFVKNYSLYLSSANLLKWRDGTSSRTIVPLTSGSTANRPSVTELGTPYFDTTLNKPIWYNGSNQWVDATGTNV